LLPPGRLETLNPKSALPLNCPKSSRQPARFGREVAPPIVTNAQPERPLKIAKTIRAKQNVSTSPNFCSADAKPMRPWRRTAPPSLTPEASAASSNLVLPRQTSQAKAFRFLASRSHVGPPPDRVGGQLPGGGSGRGGVGGGGSVRAAIEICSRSSGVDFRVSSSAFMVTVNAIGCCQPHPSSLGRKARRAHVQNHARWQ